MAATQSLLKKETRSKLQGYSTSLYKGKLDAKFLCPQCKLILRNPVQTGCGERFCRPCAELILQTPNPTCPLCGESLSQKQLFRDVFAEREVYGLPVVCENVQLGCPWEGPLRDLDPHLEDCEHVQYHCPNSHAGCDVTLPRKPLLQHANHECRFRVVPCEFCGVRVQYLALDKHLRDECVNMPVECIQCGRKDIPQDKMAQHLERNCPRAPMSCVLHDHGCDARFYRNELEEHNQQNAHVHMSYIMPVFVTLNKDVNAMKEQISTLQTENRELKSALRVLQERPVATPAPATAAASVDAIRSDSTSSSAAAALLSPITGTAMSTEEKVAVLDKRTLEMNDHVQKNKSDIETNTVAVQNLKRSGEVTSRAVTVQDVQLADLSLRLDIVDVKTTNGVLIWKIGDIKRRRHEARTGKTPSLYSAPFYTSPCGYKMCARIYLDGDGIGKGQCVSIFFVMMRGEYDALLTWPFQQRVTMMLLDQSASSVTRNLTEVFKPDTRSNSFKRPSTEMNTGSGCPMFAQTSILESPMYVKDDILFIKLIVDQHSSPFTAPDSERL